MTFHMRLATNWGIPSFDSGKPILNHTNPRGSKQHVHNLSFQCDLGLHYFGHKMSDKK